MKLNRFLAGLTLALCLGSSTFAATLLPPGRAMFADSNGKPLSGGSITFYVPNTTTLKDTYQDAGATVLNSNPVLLDAAGRATIYGSGSYRQVVKDRNGNLIWDQTTSDTSSSTSSWGGTSTGTANAQQVVAPNFTSADGQSISFIANFANTGPMTLNPSGAGPINIVNDLPSGSASLSGGEIAAGNVVQVVYSASQGNFHTAIPPAGSPVGIVLEYAGVTAPPGYLMADGSAVSRATYSKLFAAIGTAFGAGDGSATFNLPDRRGRVSVGTDGGSGRLSSIPTLSGRGGVGGEQQHTLTIGEMPIVAPSGTVSVSYPAHIYSIPFQSVGVAGGTGATVWVATTQPSSTSPPAGQTFGLNMNGFGNGYPHNVVQPSIVMNFIIKY